MAKNVDYLYENRVRWIFRGFWKGVGEVDFYSKNHKTIVEGFEYITPHGLWCISPLFEKYFMEKGFEKIWNLGWKRIRKNEVNRK